LALVAIISTADQIGFVYLSMWTMLQTTILFAVMAAVQVKNQRRLQNFTVEVMEGSSDRASIMLNSSELEDNEVS